MKSIRNMHEKHLHIVSFAIPYPPNYGGVIDVYYKLKALHKQGIKIHLHCFQYQREEAPELNTYCEEVYYYKRRQGFKLLLSISPYIVKSRHSEALIQRLSEDEYPVLFEGMHTLSCLNHKSLSHKFRIYRESNIEHSYYFSLGKAEKSIKKKAYLYLEAAKLKVFEKKLQSADLMLSVSKKDNEHLQKRFGTEHIHYLPSFHPNEEVSSKPGKGGYVLYHGNLSVAENYEAATYLINKVFMKSKLRFVIAGLNPPEHLEKMAAKQKNIELIKNPPDEKMFELIANAHINILITFQATGLKLKLLNTLYKGRFTLVNPQMLHGTGLDKLCVCANDQYGIIKKIDELFMREFSSEDIEHRKKILNERYSNKKNAEELIEYIFRSI